MRRSDREVKDKREILEIIKSCDTCRIGLMDGNTPYIVPMSFGVCQEDGKLAFYFHSAGEGRKIELMERNSSAAFEMDTAHRLLEHDAACGYGMEYRCVMGTGTITFLEEEKEKQRGLGILMSHYAPDRQLPFDEKVVRKVRVIRMEATSVSGKICKGCSN